MAARVTIQDIADSLGVSRNTVSKAINNTGSLADSTRDKVLKKAVEMGYKQFSYVRFNNPANQTEPAGALPSASLSIPRGEDIPPADAAPESTGTIALLTARLLGTSHFSASMLDDFQARITQIGYGLTIYRVSQQDLENGTLPGAFDQTAISGIICFEMFDPLYSQMLCSLGIPILFVDCPSPFHGVSLKADLLLMSNRPNIYALVDEMVQRGKKRIGFIGDYRHCQSFYERFMAYHEALFMHGISYQEDCCIIQKDGIMRLTGKDYQNFIAERIQSMDLLPEVFICANDFVCLDVLQALKKLGISVPGDVYLCGFDGSPESAIVTPPLTTIRIHGEMMSRAALHLLLSRIQNPKQNYRTVYTETTLIYRESTEN